MTHEDQIVKHLPCTVKFSVQWSNGKYRSYNRFATNERHLNNLYNIYSRGSAKVIGMWILEDVKSKNQKNVRDKIKCDADIRSMCSAGFAEAFFQNNR